MLQAMVVIVPLHAGGAGFATEVYQIILLVTDGEGSSVALLAVLEGE